MAMNIALELLIWFIKELFFQSLLHKFSVALATDHHGKSFLPIQRKPIAYSARQQNCCKGLELCRDHKYDPTHSKLLQNESPVFVE